MIGKSNTLAILVERQSRKVVRLTREAVCLSDCTFFIRKERHKVDPTGLIFYESISLRIPFMARCLTHDSDTHRLDSFRFFIYNIDKNPYMTMEGACR